MSAWKRGSEVLCARGHRVHAADLMEHGVPICRERPNHGDSTCGLAVYVIILTRNPLLFAWVDIEAGQRRYILDNNLTALQALWYLQLPTPLERSA